MTRPGVRLTTWCLLGVGIVEIPYLVFEVLVLADHALRHRGQTGC